MPRLNNPTILPLLRDSASLVVPAGLLKQYYVIPVSSTFNTTSVSSTASSISHTIKPYIAGSTITINMFTPFKLINGGASTGNSGTITLRQTSGTPSNLSSFMVGTKGLTSGRAGDTYGQVNLGYTFTAADTSDVTVELYCNVGEGADTIYIGDYDGTANLLWLVSEYYE